MSRLPHFPRSRRIAVWAVVTGASSGIGLEFSRQLAAKGCNLIMVSNQPVELWKYAAEIATFYEVRTLPLALDLTDDGASATLLDFMRERGIVPELLINNAGVFDFKSVDAMTGARLDLYIDLHVRAVTHISRAVGALMARNGGGRILNMSSMSCWMPMPGIAMYSATKAYIRAFSRAYRVEMKDSGVSVTVACPGGIATDLFGLPRKLQRLGVRLGVLMTPETFVKRALKCTIAGKAQYVNGLLNRVSIVAVACLPEWGRVAIKRRLLDRISK